MCRRMNLTIINEENLCPLLHISAPVTSLDRHTGYETVNLGRCDEWNQLEVCKSTSTTVIDETKANIMGEKAE